MASIQSIAIKRANAIERLKNASQRIGTTLDVEGYALPTQGHDLSLIQAQQLETLAGWMESVADKLIPAEVEGVDYAALDDSQLWDVATLRQIEVLAFYRAGVGRAGLEDLLRASDNGMHLFDAGVKRAQIDSLSEDALKAEVEAISQGPVPEGTNPDELRDFLMVQYVVGFLPKAEPVDSTVLTIESVSADGVVTLNRPLEPGESVPPVETNLDSEDNDPPTNDSLRDELRALGLPVSGNKAELTARLAEAKAKADGDAH